MFENQEITSFYEMSNKDLFCVLTGDKGIMAQMLLQKLIKAYLAKYTEEVDLQTMVRKMIDEEGQE